jgi:hypothetical protein
MSSFKGLCAALYFRDYIVIDCLHCMIILFLVLSFAGTLHVGHSIVP